MNRARSLLLAAGGLALALFAAACASTAESPEPSVQPSAAASPVVTPAACPTPPAAPPASLHYQTTSPGGIATLTGVQVTTQPCADRVTFTFEGTLPGYDARYVQNWTTCGSGELVHTAGPAQIAITFNPSNAHNDAGQSTIPSRSFTPSYPSVKQVELTCDFEAYVSWVLGTEERYFTVQTAQNPPRIIIDVSH